MSDVRSARLLEAAVRTLRDEILPGIVDPVARIKVDHVTRLLWSVSATLAKREGGLRAFLAAADVVVPADAGLDVLERLRIETESRMTAALPDMVARDDGAAMARLLDLERDFYISQDPDVSLGSDVVYRGGRIEREAAAVAAPTYATLDAEGLTAYVRARMGRDDVAAGDVSRIPGGFSKETIFFTLTGDGEPQKLVIRKDLPVPLIEKTVVDEFGLLQHLFAKGFPVAEPLWLEADTGRFGGAFIVSRRVSGTSDAGRWASDADRAQAACLQLARILARLHGYEPTDLGIGAEAAALSAGVHMEREVAKWRDLFHRRRAETFPLQELPLVWLAANIPAVLYDRPVRVVHGDVGFHNLMFDDAGEVTALLDWEFSVLGDPTQDLCFVRQFVEPLMRWDIFVAAYVAAGGAEPCEEAAFYYTLWTKTRNAVGCVDAQTLFDTGEPGETRFALAGHIFAPYMFVDQCETLIAHLGGRA